MNINLPSYWDSSNAVLNVVNYRKNFIHISWQAEDGKVIAIEHCSTKNNQASTSCAIYDSIEEYSISIEDETLIQSTLPYGHPFKSYRLSRNNKKGWIKSLIGRLRKALTDRSHHYKMDVVG